MGKYLAKQMCVTKTAGKMVPEVRDGEKVIWPGDIAEVDDAEAAKFGKAHLEPVAAGTPVRRWIHSAAAEGKPKKSGKKKLDKEE